MRQYEKKRPEVVMKINEAGEDDVASNPGRKLGA
ncbi:hypothetical protein MFUM_220003 [Methylacidiphilum fumariolicum SolV]|uniref:Uncharacterized protein n=2 Tax=Candidatus Methylacidiphilum fumarolicum TaxID=591154 RepID=I0JX33_METFB|nr:conserved protein of unknown function [Candidatus Methylacidiphilum fumarolicum]CCG91802.1 hypothetical protein MFUM_220003 [Methylacidiphilum fumariolicum SolV]